MSMFERLLDRAKQIKDGAQILKDWIGDGGHVVERELAQSRADVCLQCPKHSPGWGLVEAAADVIKQQIELKNHLQLRVNGERQLHVCEACGCAMKLKVHLPMSRIRPEPEERPKFWPGCWLLSEPD